ncbi:MAG: heme NO-binding domain-containing protein [Proteobacteria bacterium]|nr:heme NO-binding domain-containing protein [Pseudomonadota bacterium]
MKGIVFTTLNDMVEEKFGLATWETLLDKVHPENKGIYTAGGTYKDAELVSYVMELSKLKKIEPAQLIEAFGIYFFPVLANKYPVFLPEGISFKEFMKNVDKIIHVEVNKLYSDAILPAMSYEEPSPNELVILYRSPRKLCALAVGLTKGAANHFNVPIAIQHPICMHKGADHCRLEVTIEK